MIWVTWRQFRAQALTAAVVLALALVCAVVTGLEMHHDYAADLATCTPADDCNLVLNNFLRGYNAASSLAQILVIAAPGLIGVFWGAPLIARELENGTHQLAWNQSVTRTRWLAVKLLVVGLASMATAGVLGYLLTWWAAPIDQFNGNRFDPMTFATRDIVPLGYAAFAFALGTTVGLMLRRTVAAMAITLAVFVAVQIVMPTVVRPNLLPSTTVTYPINATTTAEANGIFGQNGLFYIEGLTTPQGSWVLNNSPVENSSDSDVNMQNYNTCFLGPLTTKQSVSPAQIGACLSKYDLHEAMTYQPASHYWPLQWIETGIFTVLAGVLSGSCFWWIRRRQN